MARDIWRKYRAPILLLLLLLAVWALAPQALDLPSLVKRFRSARPWPLLLAAALQALRYLGTGLLMCLFAGSLGHRALPLTASQVALASGAASKLVPVAGAGGIAVRFAYLRRCGVADAAIGGYFVLQNVLGTAVLVSLFVASAAAGGQEQTQMQLVAPAIATLVAFVGLFAWLRRRPGDARRLAGRLGGALDRLAGRLGKEWALQQRLDEGGDSLGRALTLGGTSPWRLAEALFYSSWTIAGDIASLHLVGLALG
ncbi:MAG: lysylphosphatidylglycerol synthase domain-containing protein, partial [Anaerolineae bacterium]